MSEEEARGQWQDSVLIAEESQASQLLKNEEGEKEEVNVSFLGSHTVIMGHN